MNPSSKTRILASRAKADCRVRGVSGDKVVDDWLLIRHLVLGLLVTIGAACSIDAAAGDTQQPPNFIIISCDNLGYGDIEPFGSKIHRTPNLLRMAREGRKFSHFYSSSGVCTPSRASLLTGCYAQRIGMHWNPRDGRVLRPLSPYGLHPEETTIAEALKPLGYRSGLVGKWHLGDQPPFLPTRQGFDFFYGIPYSDDMTDEVGRRLGTRFQGAFWPPLPMMKGETVVAAPVQRDHLTRDCTHAAIRFIETHRDTPFFLYFAQPMPGSTPRPFASETFKGRSANGAWGDAIEEIDWSTGLLLDKLVELAIDDRTLVIWTSDNGAPLAKNPMELSRGSNLPLAGRGYTTAEGGFRIPTLMWWPGTIGKGTLCSEMASTMDLLPTLVGIAGGDSTSSRTIDGVDIGRLLTEDVKEKSPRDLFYFYEGQQLQAVRRGPWKLFLPLETFERHPHFRRNEEAATLLFNVRKDPSSRHDRSQEYPEVVAKLMADAEVARRELGDLGHVGAQQRTAGYVGQVEALNLSQDGNSQEP